MKVSRVLNEIVDRKTIELASQFIKSHNDNFSAQAAFLKLDPKRDFRHADLQCVDLSNSNVRGFDFTGSDLRGATGVSVEWDHTTILRDADVSSSLFEHHITQDRFLRENPQLAEEAERIADNFWQKAILGVEAVLRRMKGDPNAARIAKAVFDRAEDPVVRSNVIYFFRGVSDNANEHKSFIYNIFARYPEETKIVRLALRALSTLYPSDIGAVNVLLHYFDHPDGAIRNEATAGVLRSSQMWRVFDRVRDRVLRSNDSNLRRLLLGRLARAAGPTYLEAATDPFVNNYLDFWEPISTNTLLLSALSMARDTFEGRRPKFDMGVAISAQMLKQSHNLVGQAKVYHALLGEIRDRFKIPIKLETFQVPRAWQATTQMSATSLC